MKENKLPSLDYLGAEQDENRKLSLTEYVEALHTAGVLVMTMFSTFSGGHTVSRDVGVRLHHVPSGIGVQVNRDRSPHNNLYEAYSLLKKLVDEDANRNCRPISQLGQLNAGEIQMVSRNQCITLYHVTTHGKVTSTAWSMKHITPLFLKANSSWLSRQDAQNWIDNNLFEG